MSEEESTVYPEFSLVLIQVTHLSRVEFAS